MKVTHKNSPKAGLTEHFQPPVAVALIAAGFADACPLPKRGTAGWHEARAEEERQRPPNPTDTNVVHVWPPIWETGTLPISGTPVILYRSGGEVTRFDDVKVAKKSGCRKDVIKRYKDLVNNLPNSDAIEYQREQRELAQQQQHAAEKLGVLAKVYTAVS